MKWLVGLLLLVNVALLGYSRLKAAHPVEIAVGHEPIAADQLRILTAEELASLPKKPAPTPVAPLPESQQAPGQTACYEWGSFSTANVSRARNILEKFSLQSELKQTASQEATRYWIYIPPLASAEKAQAKMDEVRALGIEVAFIVQEPEWRNAISLGVFKDEALATKLLQDMHGRGVKSAIKGVRNREGGQSSFTIRNMPDAVAGEIDKLKPDFSGSELKKVACQ